MLFTVMINKAEDVEVNEEGPKPSTRKYGNKSGKGNLMRILGKMMKEVGASLGAETGH